MSTLEERIVKTVLFACWIVNRVEICINSILTNLPFAFFYLSKSTPLLKKKKKKKKERERTGVVDFISLVYLSCLSTSTGKRWKRKSEDDLCITKKMNTIRPPDCASIDFDLKTRN
jgi:hypothetical protein